MNLAPAISKINAPVVLVFLFLLAELIVWPTGDFPLNDDWSYAHSVHYFNETGKTDVGYWPAMSLVSHVWWGSLFVKLFGFSHLVLRCSTICLALFSVMLLYKLLSRFGQKPLITLLLCLVLVFNPLWFLLANTFMTDVPFLFSVLISFYCLHKAVLENNKWYLAGFCFACLYSILIRQFGLALPVALFAAVLVCLLTGQKSLKDLLFYSLPLILSILCYLLYENWLLHHLPKGSAYQSASIVADKNILDAISGTIIGRFSYCMLYIGLFLFPFCLQGAYYLLRNRSRKQLLMGIPLFVLFLVFLYNRVTIFPNGNILYDTGLGQQTVYDYAIAGINTAHSGSSAWTIIVRGIAATGALCFAWIVAVELTRVTGLIFKRRTVDFFRLFLLFFVLAYFICLCISGSFFDRYTLPLFLAGLVFLAPYIQGIQINKSPSALFILLLVLFTVPATKDYFSWNKAWSKLIGRSLQKGIKPGELNGGFEYAASTFYYGDWWSLWTQETTPYKITVGPLTGHTSEDFETYQRYIPLRSDTVFLVHKK